MTDLVNTLRSECLNDFGVQEILRGQVAFVPPMTTGWPTPRFSDSLASEYGGLKNPGE